MYAITERNQLAGVGNMVSRDQSTLWIGTDGQTTPCSDMAALFESIEEAEAAMIEYGLDTSEAGWWHIVDLGDEGEGS